MALDNLSDYYLEPGAEHMPDDQQNRHFQKHLADASSSYAEIQKLLGPAAVFLSHHAAASLSKLFIEYWDLANFGAICTADYVAGAQKLATTAYEQVLHEAKLQLGIESDA